MNSAHFVYIALFAVLLKFKVSRYAAGVMLAGYALYIPVIIPLPGDYYYHATALHNLILGCILFPRYKLVALLSFTLIIVTNIGHMLYQLNYEPALFNTLSLIIISIQILLLYIRALTDGNIIRGTRGRAIFWFVNLDSYQMGSTLQSYPKGKG